MSGELIFSSQTDPGVRVEDHQHVIKVNVNLSSPRDRDDKETEGTHLLKRIGEDGIPYYTNY
jgi:hypothetical protein